LCLQGYSFVRASTLFRENDFTGQPTEDRVSNSENILSCKFEVSDDDDDVVIVGTTILCGFWPALKTFSSHPVLVPLLSN
jgi:diphthamide synthase subunit DPH2